MSNTVATLMPDAFEVVGGHFTGLPAVALAVLLGVGDRREDHQAGFALPDLPPALPPVQNPSQSVASGSCMKISI
jgi:hypothetical protein